MPPLRIPAKLTYSLALQEYSPRITKHYRLLMRILTRQAASGTPFDVSRLFMDLFFDVISDLTLGDSFNTLTIGKRNPIVREFLQYQKSLGFVLLNMWIFHLIRTISQVASRLLYLMQWYSSTVFQRGEVRKRSSRKRLWYANALRNRKQVRWYCFCMRKTSLTSEDEKYVVRFVYILVAV